MTYVVHKTKEIKDARARREEVEGKAREKRKIELTFEKKFIQACKDEIILTDGHIVAETEQMEFVLQVIEIMEENYKQFIFGLIVREFIWHVGSTYII